MATLLMLVERGALVKVNVRLAVGEMPGRVIYGFPDFRKWLEEVVPKLETGRLDALLTPAEQVDNLLYKWISDKPMMYDRALKDLMPGSDEVWELKTADLRVFGWIYKPKIFIAVFGDYADKYKATKSFRPKASYESARRTVIAARNSLDLDEPKYATGVYDDLV